MDPNACLNRIAKAKATGDHAEANDACEDLQTWLIAGSFQPDWKAYPSGSSYFKHWRDVNGIRNPPVSL